MIKEEKGQSLTEFALLVPLLLLLICGIIDFGRVLYLYMNMNLVSQEAVRLGGLGKGDAAITAFAVDALHQDTTTLQVIITPTETARKSGDYVTVTLQSNFDYITPLISQVLPSPLKVVTKSTIRVE